MENPVVTIEMENGGIITAELYPDVAPQSVYNFTTVSMLFLQIQNDLLR